MINKEQAKIMAEKLFEAHEQTSQTNDARAGALITVNTVLKEFDYAITHESIEFWKYVKELLENRS